MPSHSYHIVNLTILRWVLRPYFDDDDEILNFFTSRNLSLSPAKSTATIFTTWAYSHDSSFYAEECLEVPRSRAVNSVIGTSFWFQENKTKTWTFTATTKTIFPQKFVKKTYFIILYSVTVPNLGMYQK